MILRSPSPIWNFSVNRKAVEVAGHIRYNTAQCHRFLANLSVEADDEDVSAHLSYWDKNSLRRMISLESCRQRKRTKSRRINYYVQRADDLMTEINCTSSRQETTVGLIRGELEIIATRT